MSQRIIPKRSNPALVIPGPAFAGVPKIRRLVEAGAAWSILPVSGCKRLRVLRLVDWLSSSALSVLSALQLSFDPTPSIRKITIDGLESRIMVGVDVTCLGREVKARISNCDYQPSLENSSEQSLAKTSIDWRRLTNLSFGSCPNHFVVTGANSSACYSSIAGFVRRNRQFLSISLVFCNTCVVQYANSLLLSLAELVVDWPIIESCPRRFCLCSFTSKLRAWVI